MLTPQVGLNNTVSKMSEAETQVICGDFIGHTGKLATDYEYMVVLAMA